MEKNLVILLSIFAIACSNAETNKERKLSEVIKADILPTELEGIKLVSEENHEVFHQFDSSAEIQAESITVITRHNTSIKKAIKKKVHEVVVDVIPKKLEVTNETKVKSEYISDVFSHASFDALLKKYVSISGVVNYGALKTNNASLEKYISTLKAQKNIDEWPRNEKLAYYINAYNAYTIQLILDNYPTTSIMKINNGKAWDLEIVNLGGKRMSLNYLENEIIRPVFKEPRIHFAVNCAAISCPKLMNGAFLPNQLNSQLERQTKAFINNIKENQINEGSIKISQIFEWYADDFGDIKTYVNKYSSTKAGYNALVSYNTYKWLLNGK